MNNTYVKTGRLITRFCLISVLGFSTTILPAGIYQKEIKKPYFQSQPIFPLQDKHVHSSSIVELLNGDLLSCWFQGSGERSSNDVLIKGARLRKGQLQWTEPFIMADTPDFPDCNPTLFIDGKGRLHLIWIVVVANQWENSILKTRLSSDYLGDAPPTWEWQDIILLKPGQEFAETLKNGFKETKVPGLAWGAYAPPYEKMLYDAAQDPGKRETGWMTRIQPLTLPGGRILLPLYSDGFNLSLVAISDDDGDTWKSSLPIVGRGNVQPAIIRKNDGTLVAYMRDNGDSPGRIMTSYSKDNGNTWSAAGKSGIPNPGSSVNIIRLKDGNWCMVYNDLENERYRLAVSISHDEGASWKWTKYLEDDKNGGFSYPTVIQTKDGIVHVSYSFSMNKKETIKHAAFSENWIKENSPGIKNVE